MVEFLSPAVIWSASRSLRAVLQLDNAEEELKAFTYHPDPTFNELSKTVITETSVIIVTVSARRPSRSRSGPIDRLIDPLRRLPLLSAGSRLRQGHDGRGGAGVRRGRVLQRQHTSGKSGRAGRQPLERNQRAPLWMPSG